MENRRGGKRPGYARIKSIDDLLVGGTKQMTVRELVTELMEQDFDATVSGELRVAGKEIVLFARCK